MVAPTFRVPPEPESTAGVGSSTDAVLPVRRGLFTMGDDPRLLGSECPGCAALHFPASDACPYCGVRPSIECELPSRGTLWAWTTVHISPPGYRGPVPFGFGVVELDGRIRVVSRLTETDSDLLRQGQAVHLVLTEVGEEEGMQMVSWAFAPSGTDHR